MQESTPSTLHVSLLLFSIFTVALCGLTYELLAGAVSSYLLGNSVLWFSVTIGAFMSAMGIGAWLSRTWESHLLEGFIAVELAVGLIGGLAGPALFLAYSYTRMYTVVFFVFVACIGTCIGLEIPLLTRYLERYGSLRQAISNVMSIDYAGALGASLLFPLVLLPNLGLMKTFPAVGLLNVGVAGLTIWFFRSQLRWVKAMMGAFVVGIFCLCSMLVAGESWMTTAESRRYPDQVIFAEQSPYQRLVLTKHQDDVRLYLDGHLQFSSRDEVRYHESLVHPVMSLSENPVRVLILGGGDGMAVREILKYPSVTSVTLVDLDPVMTRMGQEHPALLKMNGGALNDPRVTVLNDDAYTFVDNTEETWSVIIMDFPDPHGEALAKLYSVRFYRQISALLTPDGVAVTQATSPYFARKAFWSIRETIRTAGFHTHPYHVWVPSFGEWGFVMMENTQREPRGAPFTVDTRWIEPVSYRNMFLFPPDMAEEKAEANTLSHPILIDYYRHAWSKWF